MSISGIVQNNAPNRSYGGSAYSVIYIRHGAALGHSLPADFKKLLGRKVYLNISRDPLQGLTHDGWIAWLARARGTTPAKRSVANALLRLSDFVVDVAEHIAALIRDRTVIIYDNTVRRAKITRGLDFMDRVSKLLASDTESIANIFGRVFPPVPDDASH